MKISPNPCLALCIIIKSCCKPKISPIEASGGQKNLKNGHFWGILGKNGLKLDFNGPATGLKFKISPNPCLVLCIIIKSWCKPKISSNEAFGGQLFARRLKNLYIGVNYRILGSASTMLTSKRSFSALKRYFFIP